MLINSISDFRKACRHGAYAWPGGYPVHFVMGDGESLCYACGTSRDNRREILEAINEPAYGPDWRPLALEVNWEDQDMICAHCYAPVESAYGEEE